MNNWLNITDIFKWFPLEINSFAQTYGYEYSGASYTKYKYYAIVTKKLAQNNPLIKNAYVNIELDLPFSLTPEQFFPFVDQQLTNLLESV